LFGDISRSVIGQMTVPTENALFQTPRATRIVLQHLHIVIRFKDENISGANAFDNQFGAVTEVGEKTNFASGRVQKKSDGINRIVRHRKRVHAHIADFKRISRVKNHLFSLFDELHRAFDQAGLLEEMRAVQRTRLIAWMNS
jgi:hypothetical protein